MSLSSNGFEAGNLKGIIYDFEFAGDTVEMHSHDETSTHITIVALGAIKIKGAGWKKELKAGGVIDFLPWQLHEFVALEDNTRIVNITKQ
jgi:quercetin dioxygenase-like cupin family protein